MHMLAGLAREFCFLSDKPAAISPESLRQKVMEIISHAFPLAPDFSDLARELCLSEARLTQMYRHACGREPGRGRAKVPTRKNV